MFSLTEWCHKDMKSHYKCNKRLWAFALKDIFVSPVSAEERKTVWKGGAAAPKWGHLAALRQGVHCPEFFLGVNEGGRYRRRREKRDNRFRGECVRGEGGEQRPPCNLHDEHQHRCGGNQGVWSMWGDRMHRQWHRGDGRNQDSDIWWAQRFHFSLPLCVQIHYI